MYTKRNYSLKDMAWWTRQDTFVLLMIALVPVILYEVFDLRWLHLPWLPIALIGTAVAFIISFQNNASYDRVWEARKIWGGIVNASRAWGIVVNDFITNDFTSDDVSETELGAIREELIFRHIAWLTALRHAMRQPRPWEHSMLHPSNKEWENAIGVRERSHSLEEELEPYLSKDQLDYVLSKSNKSTQLLSLQSKQLRHLRTRGLIDDFRHMEMENILVELFALQGKSERIKNFPYPRQYATLNSFFLWIFVLLLPFGVMFEFDKIGTSLRDSYPIVSSNFVWLSVPFSVLVMWVFHTMERIGRVSENPFEGTPNDVPITTISRGIEIDLREMLDEAPATIPPPIEARYHTQT
ncbi:MAG: bestrophin family ion channel [Polyangiales bacterium]